MTESNSASKVNSISRKLLTPCRRVGLGRKIKRGNLISEPAFSPSKPVEIVSSASRSSKDSEDNSLLEVKCDQQVYHVDVGSEKTAANIDSLTCVTHLSESEIPPNAAEVQTEFDVSLKIDCRNRSIEECTSGIGSKYLQPAVSNKIDSDRKGKHLLPKECAMTKSKKEVLKQKRGCVSATSVDSYDTEDDDFVASSAKNAKKERRKSLENKSKDKIITDCRVILDDILNTNFKTTNNGEKKLRLTKTSSCEVEVHSDKELSQSSQKSSSSCKKNIRHERQKPNSSQESSGILLSSQQSSLWSESDEEDFETKRKIVILEKQVYKKIDEEELRKKICSISDRIFAKQREIENLKKEKSYKHELKEIKGLIAKWKTGCQQSLQSLHNLLQQKGDQISLKQLINKFGIPFTLINFNPDDDSFND